MCAIGTQPKNPRIIPDTACNCFIKLFFRIKDSLFEYIIFQYTFEYAPTQLEQEQISAVWEKRALCFAKQKGLILFFFKVFFFENVSWGPFNRISNYSTLYHLIYRRCYRLADSKT